MIFLDFSPWFKNIPWAYKDFLRPLPTPKNLEHRPKTLNIPNMCIILADIVGGFRFSIFDFRGGGFFKFSKISMLGGLTNARYTVV